MIRYSYQALFTKNIHMIINRSSEYDIQGKLSDYE